ncbi:extradiol dioxygenase [Flavobacterium sp. WW92]|uniref:VOC family protein n=1 Tax=unclassified Flavobacterium TaxID=196869 RepID=UPI0022249CBA|nr:MULTISPECIES: VOC family protein [unclassified Flavobacterium]WDO13171.1 extradiol dioxygenase [Flavobacterium sp. WW92]
MAKEFWVNLPVKEISKSRAFFKAIGFTENAQFSENPTMASFFLGDKNVVVNFFPEDLFKSFSNTEIADTAKGTEALFSIDAQSPAEVDEVANKAVAAGAKLYANPGEKDGWMYGCGFSDLDGHRWNVLYMDFSKMPKQ